MTNKRIVEQSSEYSITEISLEQNGQLIDRKYIVRYKDTPREDSFLTLEKAQNAIKKHFKKEDK